jgi:hypothetical protein
MFVEEGRPVPENITDFIGWFSHQIGVSDDQETD